MSCLIRIIIHFQIEITLLYYVHYCSYALMNAAFINQLNRLHKLINAKIDDLQPYKYLMLIGW